MVNISKEEIAHVAELARIELATTELEVATNEVSSILSFVEKLQTVNTDGVVSTSQITKLSGVWRKDEVIDCKISRDQLLANTPQTQDGYVKVRKVL